jgi:hypothetical protein
MISGPMGFNPMSCEQFDGESGLLLPSCPRRRESRLFRVVLERPWMPAFTGMTTPYEDILTGNGKNIEKPRGY